MTRTTVSPSKQTEVLDRDQESPTNDIVLYNDDVNTFDHVITCLMLLCDHEQTQAEQCATIVHHKGKCAVKSGTYHELEPVTLALLEQGLSVKIE